MGLEEYMALHRQAEDDQGTYDQVEKRRLTSHRTRDWSLFIGMIAVVPPYSLGRRWSGESRVAPRGVVVVSRKLRQHLDTTLPDDDPDYRRRSWRWDLLTLTRMVIGTSL